METGLTPDSSITQWITVIVAAIVAIATLGGSFVQNWFSHRRFKVELGRAIDVEKKKRSWEVRSRPLLKLRDELSIIAAKSDLAVYLSSEYQKSIGTLGEKEAKKKQQDALHDWNEYAGSGTLRQTMLIQYDKELVEKVSEIVKLYAESYEAAIRGEKPVGKSMSSVIEAQGLINKRLEEL